MERPEQKLRTGIGSCSLAVVSLLLALMTTAKMVRAEVVNPPCPAFETSYIAEPTHTGSVVAPHTESRTIPLIVVGFMGGRIHGDNIVHREAVLTRDLQQHYKGTVHAEMFANHDGNRALKSILQLLNRKRSGCLNQEEKRSARIVIFGHSWGASETVHLARQLNDLSIPVLLTIQVDSVQKLNEDDTDIPPNVREAVNFYQDEGLLHGRRTIAAMDPHRTTILGNYQSTYKNNEVSISEYPWFARTFMKTHIEIENDPVVWNKVEALIVERSCEPLGNGTKTACLNDEQIAHLPQTNLR